jgi:hypothetical protein
MQEGLLWFDANPKRDLAQKVARAAERYRFKFGRRPNLCYVHSSMLPASSAGRAASAGEGVQGSLECEGVHLVAVDHVLKHHFWIGVEDAPELRKVA